MLEEHKNGMKTVINIWCDRKGCTNQDSVYSDNRDVCQRILFERGWVLRKDKHYCSDHGRKPRGLTLRAAVQNDASKACLEYVHDIARKTHPDWEYCPTCGGRLFTQTSFGG